jgi:uncharacterized cupin superfamily protein
MKLPATLKASDAPKREGSRYPAPFNEICMDRTKHLLGDVFGLTQFGVNLAVIAPGAWSSQRHWHEKEDEFIYMLEGELVLCDDAGEHILTQGMCAGFKAGNGNGHCLKNLTHKQATYLEVGSRFATETAWYSDIDMKVDIVDRSSTYNHKDGTPY